MASVDLKDAYYSAHIDKEYKKYLKFLWEYTLKFIVMPNGYGPVMRAFTKLIQPPFSFLRSEGYLSVIYVDDCYLQGDLFTKCAKNVVSTIDILESLGFYIKMEKSEIIPKQQITFLGVKFEKAANRYNNKYPLMQVLMVGGQFVKNLRQEACGLNKSRHYTSMLLNF